jgi:hypothetical protein
MLGRASGTSGHGVPAHRGWLSITALDIHHFTHCLDEALPKRLPGLPAPLLPDVPHHYLALLAGYAPGLKVLEKLHDPG